jgi:predicted DNA-binding mobile mystery protein A
MKTNQLTVQQLDSQLKSWMLVKKFFQPQHGWIRTIRKSLGITTKQLAAKLGISRTRIIKIESDELREVLTMQTLHLVAEALNCDFIYALVPKESLQSSIDKQATKVATKTLQIIAHNMLLENQQLTAKQNTVLIDELKNRLLKKSLKKLWNDR